MKRVLIALSALLMSFNAYAGIITYDVLTADSGVSYTHFNSSFSEIYDEFNGNISTVNILNDTLTEPDFADAINPRVRDYELIGDYTYTGHLPATDTDLTSDISAGTSYVNGYRLVTAATSKTYTASKDTWVYIDQNGAFQYQEVANGAAQPTSPSNSLLLAKAVTNGTAITSVTDYRTTAPVNLRIYQDLKSGCIISRDPTTATKIDVLPGEIEFGSDNGKVRRNTSTVYIDTTTTGRGGLDTGTLSANSFYYVFALADDDNSSNFECVASLSSTDASGLTGERLIGWFYADSASSISPDSVGAYKGKGGDAPNISGRSTTLTQTTAASGVTAVGVPVKFYTSGRPVEIKYGLNMTPSASTSPHYISLSIDNAVNKATEVGYTTVAGYQMGVYGSHVTRHLGAGEHTVTLKTLTSSAHPLSAYTIIVEEK